MEQKIGREAFENLLRFKMRPEDVELVMEAYRMSKYGHRGQTRESGERYFEHPKTVALMLIKELGIYDRDMIIVALLHDTEEDTYIFGTGETAFDTVEKQFGKRPSKMLRVLSKEPCEPEQKIVRDTKYNLGMGRADAEVKVIKILDRLHNMDTIVACSTEKQKRKLEETRTYYLPIAREIAKFFPLLLERLEELCANTETRIELHESAARPPQPFPNNNPGDCATRTEEST